MNSHEKTHLTTDRNDPDLKVIESSGMQKKYLVLSEEERAKGFVRPVRRAYLHIACGSITTMGLSLSETYARDPSFYTGTYCAQCGTHFPLKTWNEQHDDFVYNFLWEDDDLRRNYKSSIPVYSGNGVGE